MVKILIVKFMMVDGVKKGKSVSFMMDPVVMAKYKTKGKVEKVMKEFAVELGVFAEGELDSGDVKVMMDEFLVAWKNEVRRLKELEAKK